MHNHPQGHFLPPFPDGSANRSTTVPPSATSHGEGADKDRAAEQEQLGAEKRQQQQQQQGVCEWGDAPSRRRQQQGTRAANATAAGNRSSSSNTTSGDSVTRVMKATLEQQIEQAVEAKCRHLCSRNEAAAAALSHATATLRAALPLLPLPPGAPALLRARRCTACKEVTRTLRRAQLGKTFLAAMSGKARVQAAADAVRLSNRPAFAASGQPVNRQFLCVVEVRTATWGCGAGMAALPHTCTRPSCQLHTIGFANSANSPTRLASGTLPLPRSASIGRPCSATAAWSSATAA